MSKTKQVGVLSTSKLGYDSIQLGNLKNKDPKYNYTVKLQFFDSTGNLILEKTNPQITLWEPKEGSPSWVKKNAAVYVEDYVKSATEQIEEGI